MERQGASSVRTLDVPQEAVATVLADPRSYDGIVVGSRRIRWFDPAWPAPGSRFHHTLGAGPLTIRDHSEVVEEDLPHRLVLVVHLRPMGSAAVDFRLTGEGRHTRVEITETPRAGALAFAWSRPLAALTRWRNDRVLARLEEVAAGRAQAMARGEEDERPEAAGQGSGRPRRSLDAEDHPRPG